MKKQIVSFIRDLKSSKKLHALDEASIKQAVVLKLLSLLGWDIFDVDEVSPDFSVESERVSYALAIGGRGKAFLEVKRQQDTLDDCHKRIVAFASREGVELAVHTDGMRWWFYLPSLKGTLNQKRCHVLDLFEKKPEDAAADLNAFLSRGEILTDGYLEAARLAYENQKRKIAAEFLPEAWNKVLAGPNKILVEILSDATEKLCGCKAEPGMIEAFIRSNVERWTTTAENRSIPASSGPAEESGGQLSPSADSSSDIGAKKPEFFADKSISSFTFQNNTFPVKSWEDMLTTLCDVFAVAHAQEFEKVLWLYDDQKHLFSRYSDQLRFPEKIKKTNIYVETRLAPEEVVKTVGDLLTRFGYGHEELVITTQ
jgi:predicted type IV restriction endonuclease